MSRKIDVYSASELKEEFPNGYERAYSHWKEHQDEIFWMDEIIESMKAVFEKSEIKIYDWSLGAYCHSYVKFDMGDAGDLEGNRALAWIENNLFYKLRETKPFSKRVKYYNNKPHNFTHYGQMKECPLTGYCADMDFLDSLVKGVKDGMTLSDVYHNLADVCSKLLEQELDNQMSEEFFLDHADANEYEYTEEGDRI